MVHIEGDIVINRTPEEVFDFVADERNEPRYNPKMRLAEKISDGPIGLGTRFRAQTVSMGRPVDMVVEVTGYQRSDRLGITTHMSSMDLHGWLTFDPVPVGTRMRWSWDLQPGDMLRMLSPLVASMGLRQEQTIWTGLKDHLEAQTN